MKKVKISSICKKVLSIGMLFAVFAQTSILFGTTAFAEEKNNSSDVTYKENYLDESTGITYYDIYFNKTERSSDEKKVIRDAINYGDTKKNWARVAYDVIGSEEQAYSAYKNKSFEKCWGNNNPTYFDLVEELYSNEKEVIKGNKGKDCSYRTGLQIGYSLSDARDAMYNIPVELRNAKLKASHIRKYSDVPILNDETEQLVLYDFVGNNERYGATFKYHYNVFGLVFYDFEFCPICDDKGIYTTTAMQEMLQDTSKEVASCDGFSYASDKSGGLSVTTLNNDSKTESKMSMGSEVTYSQTLSNTIDKSHTDTYGQAIRGQIGGEFTKFTAKLGIDFTFEEMYETAYSNTEANGKEETESTNVEFNVPAYSTVSVGKNTSTKSIVIDYKQAVAIKYKTAVVAIRGGFYDDNAATLDVKGYDQAQFSTIFGAVNQNNQSDGTVNDAVTSLKNRYNTYKEDGNNNAEKKAYTLLTKKKGCKGSSSTSTLSRTLNWSSIENQKYGISSVINDMNEKSHTMSAVGARMTGKETVTEYFGSEPVITNPLKNIKVYDDSIFSKAVTEENIVVGDDLSFAKYAYKGYFSDGVTLYPDFDASKGYWIMIDDKGEKIEKSEIADLEVDHGNNQRLKAKTTGTVYVKYLITEDKDNGYYYYNASSASAKQIKNIDLASVPVIKINIHSSRTEAAVASMFSTDNTGKLVTVIVGIAVIVGTIIVIIKKRKNIKKN